MKLSGEFDPAALTAAWLALDEAVMDKMPWGGDYKPRCAARVDDRCQIAEKPQPLQYYYI